MVAYSGHLGIESIPDMPTCGTPKEKRPGNEPPGLSQRKVTNVTNSAIITHPSAGAQDTSTSTPINLFEPRHDKITFKFCAMRRTVMDALAGATGFDFGKVEIRVILFVLNKQFSKGDVFSPARLSNKDIAKGTQIDPARISAAITGLVARTVLVREGEAIALVQDVETWLLEAPNCEKRNYEKSGKFAKTAIQMAETAIGNGGKRNLELRKAQSPVAETAIGDPENTTKDEGFEDRIDMRENIENNHENHGESLAPASTRDRALLEISTEQAAVRCRVLTVQLAKTMQAAGYQTPPGKGSDPVFAFKKVVERYLQFKRTDPQAEELSDLEFLEDFVTPAIEDCPVQFRDQFASYDLEFCAKLAMLRRMGGYANPWPKKKKGGMSPHSDFSKIEPGDSSF